MGDGDIDLRCDSDYREMDAYKLIKNKIKAKKAGRYIWLPQSKKEKKTKGKKTKHQLLREVPTEIDVATAMVRFTKHVLPQEVHYVLKQIRDHC